VPFAAPRHGRLARTGHWEGDGPARGSHLAPNGDLLIPEVQEALARFRACSLLAQRLYVRMLTPKGPWFRRDGLHDAEIGDPDSPSVERLQTGFCEDQATQEDLPHWSGARTSG
jgi:hypothetical protein